jgi:hypothetical protein
MKKMVLLLSLGFIVSFSFSQSLLERKVVYDTTRTDGQRFIISWPFGVRIILVDSLAIKPGDSVFSSIYPYYSTVNSKIFVKAQRLRIVSGDTMVRYEEISVNLFQLKNNAANFLTDAVMKKAIKPTCKEWIKYKLNQE